MKKINSQSGYIALISAILISVSLLTLVIAVSFEGFYSRFSVLESEQKEISAYLAESCVNTAILKIAQDKNYSGNEDIRVGKLGCRIFSVYEFDNNNPFPPDYIIEAQGTSSDAYTNLEVQIEPSDSSIVSWTEVPSF